MSRLFEELREGDVYSNVSFEESVWFHIKQACDQDGIAYHHHYNKQINGQYKDDDILQKLYKEKKRINKEISEREQNLNL